jgi:hypothetical protein
MILSSGCATFDQLSGTCTPDDPMTHEYQNVDLAEIYQNMPFYVTVPEYIDKAMSRFCFPHENRDHKIERKDKLSPARMLAR